MPMLAGVGLLVVCCSSSSAMMMMGGGEEKEDPVVPKTPAKKSPEQIKADEAKAALAALKADPDARADDISDAQMEADNAQAAAAAADAADAADTTAATPSMLKCINTQKRGAMGWTFKERVKTEAEARALCPDSEYMSLECPTADGFEVFCVDDISQAGVLTDKECKGDVAGTALHGGANAHCVGPYKWGDVHGGGANRGSLYKI